MEKANYLKSLLLMLTLLLSASASAYDIEVDGIYYNINGRNAVVTYKEYSYGNYISDYSGDVTIPETITYNGTTYSVIGIGANAFYSCTGLTSITIPNSVISIAANAFQLCRGLTSITIPNSVIAFEIVAFYDCTWLTSINFGNSVLRINENAFYNCRNLNSLTLPYSLESVGNSAFGNCENLTDVTCLSITPPSCPDGAFYPAYYMATLHVPERSLEAYKATASWNKFLTIVGDASSSTPTNRCDVNGDGEVTIADVNMVINAILGIN